jgi:GNAT superfamily N-acetyltransferase
VGFRFGTDAELSALHLVESEIETERHPDAVPQPLESYFSYARSLPPQFEDHTWVAEKVDGPVVGSAACWTNSAGDPQIMESYLYVRHDWRRHGFAWRLLNAVVDEASVAGPSTLMWSTYDAIPAGDAFSRRIGGHIGRVNRTSELRLDDIDWGLVRSWQAEGPLQAEGYRLEFWDGPLPDHLADDAARFHHIMNAQPRDDLEMGDIVLSSAQVVDLDRHLAESGRQKWTLFVRDPDGQCVGGTELTFESWEPRTAHQQNTGIHPDHRGIGLAKWAKAAMLVRLRSERPEVERVRTSNAFSNEAMLAINTALGFKVVEVRTEWQGKLSELSRSVRNQPSLPN